MTDKPFEVDYAGMKKHQERMSNGFRLFGKYLEFELISFYRHAPDSEWRLSVCYLECDFEYADGRSLFRLGKKDTIWFLDLFWKRILPRGDK